MAPAPYCDSTIPPLAPAAHEYLLLRAPRLNVRLRPMAYAMMGGIIVGTLLTLLFLPALYVALRRRIGRRSLTKYR